jgi:hypothetical protein
MNKYRLMIIILCLNFSCQKKIEEKRYLVEGIYSYETLLSVVERFKTTGQLNSPEFNEFLELNLQEMYIKDFNLYSIPTNAHIDFYNRKLMRISFDVNIDKTDVLDSRLKNQKLDKYVKFYSEDGKCYKNSGIIGVKSTTKCYCWYDERLLKLYDKAYNKANNKNK